MVSNLSICFSVNGIKDGLFQGNEDAYYLTENAFAFAASAMIPIGHASTAGNLTFKSTATIVAKEGISMGAGAGAQKITTDVTGNDTAGMVAGCLLYTSDKAFRQQCS